MKICEWCPNQIMPESDFCSEECQAAFHGAGGNAKLPGNPKTGVISGKVLGNTFLLMHTDGSLATETSTKTLAEMEWNYPGMTIIPLLFAVDGSFKAQDSLAYFSGETYLFRKDS